jgi:hypothetical protein
MFVSRQSPMVLVLDRKSLDEGQIIGCRWRVWIEASTFWCYKKLWKLTMFNGKINYFYGHFQ